MFEHGFKHSPKGLFAYLVNKLIGKVVYRSDLRRALKAIEKS